MAKNFVYIGIAVLALIAVVLGYKIYQQKVLNPASLTTQPTQNRTTSGSVVNQGTPSTPQNNYSLLENAPSKNSSDEDKKKFATAITAQAQSTEALDITGCKANPVAFKVKINSDFKIKNSDAVEHKLFIGGGEKYTIPANSTITAKAIFSNGAGTYGYACDQVNKNEVGFFFVTE